MKSRRDHQAPRPPGGKNGEAIHEPAWIKLLRLAGIAHVAVALLAVALLAGVGASAFAAGLTPAINIEPGTAACIAPPAEMRRTHMQLLAHQRDKTLRQGERGAKVSLNACVDCHASKQTGSVIAGEQDFCRSCHAYAAVRITCFECHQSKSRKNLTASAEARR